MLKSLRITAGLLALALSLTAAVPEEKSIPLLRLLGFFPCCVGEVCEPTGCWLFYNCTGPEHCVE
jgi:hypothetical protein